MVPAQQFQKTYIPKKQRQFAEQLALKTYLIHQLNYLKQKQTAAEQYLSAYPKTNEAELLLDNEPEFQMLLQPYLTPLPQELADWEKAPYEKNLKYPEQLTHKTVDNIFVRSKSEAMIAMALRFHKIPFRYECLLEIGNYHIYPDFTLRHPANGKLYYWEHFGMMDDPIYNQKASLKLKDYISNGVIPSINLITTYETRDEPLNTKIIEKIIEYHFH